MRVIISLLPCAPTRRWHNFKPPLPYRDEFRSIAAIEAQCGTHFERNCSPTVALAGVRIRTIVRRACTAADIERRPELRNLLIYNCF